MIEPTEPSGPWGRLDEAAATRDTEAEKKRQQELQDRDEAAARKMFQPTTVEIVLREEGSIKEIVEILTLADLYRWMLISSVFRSVFSMRTTDGLWYPFGKDIQPFIVDGDVAVRLGSKSTIGILLLTKEENVFGTTLTFPDGSTVELSIDGTRLYLPNLEADVLTPVKVIRNGLTFIPDNGVFVREDELLRRRAAEADDARTMERCTTP